MGERNKVTKVENKSKIENENDYRPKEYISIGERDKDKKRLLYPVDFSSNYEIVGRVQDYNGSGGLPPKDWHFSLRGIDLETDEGINLEGTAYEGFAEIFDVKPWFSRKHDILFSGTQGFVVYDVSTGDSIPTYNETKEVYNELKEQGLADEELNQKMIEWAKEQQSNRIR